MATIRDDLVGAIHVGGIVLSAGDHVPANMHVHESLLSAKPEPKPAPKRRAKSKAAEPEPEPASDDDG